MIYRILGNLLFKIITKQGGKTPKCKQCKVVMQKNELPRLFLLPIFHDAEYTPSEEYYLTHCKLIRDVAQIPTGQRACRFWELTCPRCALRNILIEDFLRVRDTKVIENRELYQSKALFDLFDVKSPQSSLSEDQTVSGTVSSFIFQE